MAPVAKGNQERREASAEVPVHPGLDRAFDGQDLLPDASLLSGLASSFHAE